MRISGWLVLSVLMVSLPRCGGTVGGQADGGAAANGGAWPGTGTGGAGQGGQAGGVSCGARLGDTCAMNQFCDFPDDRCGAADGTGTCRPIPEECPLLYQPTCGCDGKVHGNECETGFARTDVSILGCPAPPDLFSCGPRFCGKGREYCQKNSSDVSGQPDGYTCFALPSGCLASPPPNCACLTGDASFPACTADAEGNLTVVYPGG
jgi:hypothetical protein